MGGAIGLGSHLKNDPYEIFFNFFFLLNVHINYIYYKNWRFVF